MPWHEEQVSAKIALPWAMSAGDGPPGVAADAALPAPVTAAYTTADGGEPQHEDGVPGGPLPAPPLDPAHLLPRFRFRGCMRSVAL